MKMNFHYLTMALATAAAFTACQPQKDGIRLEHQGDTLTIVHITNPSKYLILPIQESCNEGKVKLVTGSPADMAMDIRLAVDSVEYYVPFALPQGSKEATVAIRRVASNAICWDSIRLFSLSCSLLSSIRLQKRKNSSLLMWLTISGETSAMDPDSSNSRSVSSILR